MATERNQMRLHRHYIPMSSGSNLGGAGPHLQRGMRSLWSQKMVIMCSHICLDFAFDAKFIVSYV